MKTAGKAKEQKWRGWWNGPKKARREKSGEKSGEERGNTQVGWTGYGPGWGVDLWNIWSRAVGEIDLKSREKGDLPPPSIWRSLLDPFSVWYHSWTQCLSGSIVFTWWTENCNMNHVVVWTGLFFLLFLFYFTSLHRQISSALLSQLWFISLQSGCCLISQGGVHPFVSNLAMLLWRIMVSRQFSQR